VRGCEDTFMSKFCEYSECACIDNAVSRGKVKAMQQRRDPCALLSRWVNWEAFSVYVWVKITRKRC